MSKVYIEHDDHHNAAWMKTFDSEDEAIKWIVARDPMCPSEDEVRQELFSEEGSGEYSGCDRWTLITEDDARGRSDYWDEVAEAIRADKEAPP